MLVGYLMRTRYPNSPCLLGTTALHPVFTEDCELVTTMILLARLTLLFYLRCYDTIVSHSEAMSEIQYLVLVVTKPMSQLPAYLSDDSAKDN